MSERCLIIVISDDLADIHSNRPHTFDGTSLLIPEKLRGQLGVEQSWTPSLEQRIFKMLEEFRPESVRVAVHKKCISETDGDELRYFGGEGSLREKSGIVDVQVMGFRHETESVPVWNVLYDLKPLLQRMNSGESDLMLEVEGLVGKLKNAFLEWHVGGLKSGFANCKSAVMGCLESVGQGLQLRKERREAGDGSSQTETDKSLSRLEYARTQLKEYMDLFQLNDPIIFGRVQPRLQVVADRLKTILGSSDRVMNSDDVHYAIEEFRRWKEHLRSGFTEVERELSRELNS